MSWDKTVKDDGVEFAPVFLKGFLGADCPGKDRRSVQTFIQKEADILGIFVTVGNKIRSADEIQKQMLYQEAQHIAALCHRPCQIGRKLSPDHILSVPAVP